MFNLVLSMLSPLTVNYQKLKTLPLPMHCVRGASLTHTFLNRQAKEILYNDGYRKEADFFSYFSEELDLGVTWADTGLKAFCHFYDNETKAGKWLWPNATLTCEYFLVKSLELWKNKQYVKAMFFLGAATHLVQDMCVPHHSRCVLGKGHVEFERWVRKHRENYSITHGDIYLDLKKPEEWIHLNAAYSFDYFPYVQLNSPEDHYHLAASILLPRAQASTSGFWLWFYRLVH